jgi:hypothetical protein
MPYRFATLILAASVICATAPLAAAQSGWLRDRVRERGDITFDLIACGPLTGLKEIVQETELTVEGMVTLAESALTAAEDGVYTDYVIDVMRVFRVRSQTLTRSTPGPTGSLPFVADEPLSRPTAATTTRVRLRGLHSGRVVLDGGVVTARGGGPLLKVGQHVIISGYFDESRSAWVPFGAFEVRDGRVVPLDERLQTKAYDSVEDFAKALADPPPTAGQSNDASPTISTPKTSDASY